jgi:catechol 2,3-dioxygenase-like lactoylglutathione lyase family enzyme
MAKKADLAGNSNRILAPTIKEGSMDMPRISQLDHVSVLITDVDRSRRFYGEVLGLREINKPRTFDFVVLWFELGNHTLHLLLKDQPDTISPRHFALRVDDAGAARSYFRKLGQRVDETTLIPGADRFFIADPDGNRIEIIQWLRPYRSEENAPSRT